MNRHALAQIVLAGWILATPPIDFDAVKTWTRPEPWPKGFTPGVPIREGAPRSQ
jgi:hypothetical protein